MIFRIRWTSTKGGIMIGRWIAAALALGLSAGAATAQNSLKQQLIGTWDFVVAEITAPDGKKSYPFGEVPKGILIFTPDGRFAQIHVAADAPKIASNNRLTGTAEEYAPSCAAACRCSGPTRWTGTRRP